MTGIERLCDIVNDGPYSGGMIHISVQKLREICEQIEREVGVETVKSEAIRAADNRRVELCAALGIDTDAGWSDAMAEMVKRLMPEGMSWPLFEDGEPVHPGDRLLDKGGDWFEAVSFVFTCDWWSVRGYQTEGFGDLNNETRRKLDGMAYGTRVKRPAPKVLDADGVEIRVGDTVWHKESGMKFTVEVLPSERGYQSVYLTDYAGAGFGFDPNLLTHRAPALAADGKPLREGDIVWDTKGNGPYSIQKIENDGVIRIDGSDLDYFGCEFVRERPDSWERWIEDADKSPCGYFGSFGPSCDGCQHDPFMCEGDMNIDLVRRAKALAGGAS